MAIALAAVLCISGIAGYRSGMKEKMAAENAAEFRDAAQVEETDGKVSKVELDVPSKPANAGANEEGKESTEDAEAANAATAETFGEEAKMIWPVDGDLVKDYSMDTTIYFDTLDQYKVNPGLMIQADVNEEVVAAFGGTVTEISDSSEYGTMLTVDMGEGYEAVYGQMKDLSVEEGSTIVKGQALGNVATPTSYYTNEGSHLFFEIKKDGKPVDPKAWLAEK